MDACDLLMQQHREVEAMFQRSRLLDDEELVELIEELAAALTVHAELEEQIFYPGVKRDETEGLLADSVEDHRRVKQLLVDLLDGEPDDPEYSRTLDELVESVQAHVREEETDLFPQVRSLLDEDELVAMADRMKQLADDLRSEEDVAEHLYEEKDAAAPI
jgi:hemerythrin superfamily protein